MLKRIVIVGALALASLGAAAPALADKINTIIGTAGDDTLVGTKHRDLILGLPGSDFLFGLKQDDVLRGGWDNDFLYGGLGDDRLLGGRGNDLLASGGPLSGQDILRGGPGVDRCVINDGDVAIGCEVVVVRN
jgi:Ca2+-binding RTX toxin-like protein